jgi:NTP pyrophosphatase (non-canonical NTP hydrolase)
VKDTFEDEIADTVIRLLDLSEGLGIDIEKHIRLKLEYNKTRPHKHGKKY